MARVPRKLTVYNFSDLCVNAPPVFKSAPPSLRFTEKSDNASGENSFIHTATTKLRFADFDFGNQHSAACVPCGSAYLGTFALSAVNQAANTVTWTFSVSDGALDYLQAGQTLIQKYKVTISDGHGGRVTQIITVKLVGTNDAPIITSPPQSATITELTSANPQENLLTHERGGTITFTDVDLLDTHTATVTPQGGGYLGTFTLAPVNQGANSVGWSFNVPDSVLDALAPGQTLTQTYRVVINDGHGGTAAQNVVVTIIGTGDPPGVTENVASLIVHEAALDLVKDGNDIAAGAVTGTNPASTQETDTSVNGLTFTAGSASIVSIGFADPGNLLDAFADPALANLASGTPSWSLLAGGRLLVLSISGLPALMLSLTGANVVPANSSGGVTVTATLLDAVNHLPPPDFLDVILSGVRVVATDSVGVTVAGTVNVNIVDDAPTDFVPESACVGGEPYATATAALDTDTNIDPNFGADGGGISFPPSLDGTESGMTSGGQPIVYALIDAHTLQGKVGSDVVFTVTLNSDGSAGLAQDTYTVTMGPCASIDAPHDEEDCGDDSEDGESEDYGAQSSSDDACDAGENEETSYGNALSQTSAEHTSEDSSCESQEYEDESEHHETAYGGDDCIDTAPCCAAGGASVQISIPVRIIDGDGDTVTASLPITFHAAGSGDDEHEESHSEACESSCSESSCSESSCSETSYSETSCGDEYVSMMSSDEGSCDVPDPCRDTGYAGQPVYAQTPYVPDIYC